MEGSGSISLNNGSGSGRPKNLRIQNRIRNTGVDYPFNAYPVGDDMERVVWRSKQALDFSFLMMYAQSRATFYVQVNATVWHTLQNAVPVMIYLPKPTDR